MKKGFTLIELLAVLVILSIIIMITVVSVQSVLSNSKKEVSQLQIKNIEDAAKAYYLKEGMSINDNCVSVSYLISEGYIEGQEVLDPETKEELKGFVKISYEANQYSYKYQEEACIYTAVTEETKTTGEVPTTDTDGNIVSGSEFKIEVNDEIGKLTFFVLSNEGDYVNLIAEQNIAPNGTFTSELQDGDEWYVTDSNSSDNRFGPQIAYEYLSQATSKWTNIPIIENFNYDEEEYKSIPDFGYQSIITALKEGTTNYTTIITPLSGDTKTYENMRARLPYYNEIIQNVGCTSSNDSCPTWMINHLSSNDNYGYWTMSSGAGSPTVSFAVYHNGTLTNIDTGSENLGVRPVITIPKEQLLISISKN